MKGAKQQKAQSNKKNHFHMRPAEIKKKWLHKPLACLKI